MADTRHEIPQLKLRVLNDKLMMLERALPSALPKDDVATDELAHHLRSAIELIK
jgi:hypothetical protein